MLSAAKHLAAQCDRPFASLRVTDPSLRSGRQTLRFAQGDSGGADVSALGRFPDIPIKKLICIIGPYRCPDSFVKLLDWVSTLVRW